MEPTGKKNNTGIFTNFVCDAVNDYSLQYAQNYITGDDPILKQLDPDLFHALEQWTDRPELPSPEWPDLPGS